PARGRHPLHPGQRHHRAGPLPRRQPGHPLPRHRERTRGRAALHARQRLRPLHLALQPATGGPQRRPGACGPEPPAAALPPPPRPPPPPAAAPPGLIDTTTNGAQVTAAIQDRQRLAKDIFDALLRATGAIDPQVLVDTPVAPTDAAFQATRYLAQLAVNIVDY